MTKKVKWIIGIAAASVLVIGGAVAGILLARNGGEPVKVFSVEELSQMWYSGESGSNGTVYSQGMQKVYLSNTQILTEVHVQAGQNVKAGDPLVSFDSTLSQVALERQRIQVGKTELELDRANKRLRWILSLVPMTPPTPAEDEELTPHPLPYPEGGEGTEDDPYRILWGEGLYLEEELMIDDLLPAEPAPDGLSFEEATVWVILEVRECDDPAGRALSRSGLILHREADGSAVFAPFDPPAEEEDDPEIPDNESGYTAREIAQMRADQQAVIQETTSRLRSEKLKLSRMQAEFDNGTVTAQEDGVVTSVNEESFARETGEPIVTVSAGGGIFVRGEMSEWKLETLTVGQTLKIYCYDSDVIETGVVESIGKDPVSETSYDGNNPNASSYPVVIRMGEDSYLRDGDYVSISSDEEEDNGLYMFNAFVAEENGTCFVYVQGENGRLEKRSVTAGKLMWGSLLEIREGLTEEDRIAFPYGTNVKPGARCVSAGIDELYDYE